MRMSIEKFQLDGYAIDIFISKNEHAKYNKR